MFLFGSNGNSFPVRDFDHQVGPWLSDESASWVEHGELLEGVGCWSPLFPARYDDIMLAASVVVKELTRMRRTQPEQPTLGVFQQVSTEGGFESF